jgi:CRP/FNR family transcriptional regulator
VFGKLDVRLASTLLRRASSGAPEVSTTHQELAVELGSSREVVSRVLKEWERRGLIGLARGTIRIVSSEKLQEISSEGD